MARPHANCLVMMFGDHDKRWSYIQRLHGESFDRLYCKQRANVTRAQKDNTSKLLTSGDSQHTKVGVMCEDNPFLLMCHPQYVYVTLAKHPLFCN